MPYFTTREGKIFYDEKGSGANSLVFIHGAQGSHRLWERQVPFFSSEYRVISLDVRGHGSSFKPKTGYQMEKMVEDVRKLLDYLDTKKAVLIGSSMGGVIAQMFAYTYPKRVIALGLVGTLAKAVWLDAPEKHAEGVARNGYEKGVRSWFTPHSKRRDIQFALVEGARVSPHFRTGVILENPEWDIRNKISRIAVPTLIVVGKEDINTTPVKESKIIHRKIPNSTMHIIPSAGHLVMLEQPEIFNKMLYEFLKANGI